MAPAGKERVPTWDFGHAALCGIALGPLWVLGMMCVCYSFLKIAGRAQALHNLLLCIGHHARV